MSYREPAGHDPIDPAGFVWTNGRRRALWIVGWPLLGFLMWLSIGVGWASWLASLRCTAGGLFVGAALAMLLRSVSAKWPWEHEE